MVEVEVVDHGLTILILVDNPLIKIPNVVDVEIKVGEGDMDITHNKVNPQPINTIIIHPNAVLLYESSPSFTAK